MYSTRTVLFAFVLIFSIDAWRIPFFQNFTLVALSSAASTITYNRTCTECVCQLPSHTSVLNCFPNGTCQSFSIAPHRYRVVPMAEAKLFFPNGILPNKSQCCKPNLTEVIAKLDVSIWTNVSLGHPRCLVRNGSDMIFTTDLDNGHLRGYDANQLTPVVEKNMYVQKPFALAYQNDAFYISFNDRSLMVLDSRSFTVLATIDSSYFQGIRDVLFLHEARTMVVACSSTRELLFFKQMNDSLHNYTFSFRQNSAMSHPNALLRINDSFFYAVSWADNTVYSLVQRNETFWKETLFFNGTNFTTAPSAGHLFRDECDHFWLAFRSLGFLILDHEGKYLGSFQSSKFTEVFDGILSENYVLHVSDAGRRQIFRLDPQITC